MTQKKKLTLLIAIPCLNEEATIGQVLKSLPTELAGVSQIDRLVINDGSTDRSAAIAGAAGAIVISNSVNRGVGFCFQRAVEFACSTGYDIMVTIDADGQFSPDEIAPLILPIVENQADFVAGSRFLKSTASIEHMSWVKQWGNRRMNQLVNRLARGKFTDVSCGFRAYAREALLRLNLHGSFTYTQETFLSLAFINMRIMEVPISVKYFAGRKSRVAGSIVKYAFHTSKIIFRTYRDYQPLRFFLGLSALFCGAGLFFLAILLGWYLFHGTFSPHIWSGMVGGFLMMAGLLFFCLALLADMFVRGRRNEEEIIYRLKKMNLSTRNLNE
jgi:glycosyltransferase involved in cell wall biosynthesis